MWSRWESWSMAMPFRKLWEYKRRTGESLPKEMELEPVLPAAEFPENQRFTKLVGKLFRRSCFRIKSRRVTQFNRWRFAARRSQRYAIDAIFWGAGRNSPDRLCWLGSGMATTAVIYFSRSSGFRSVRRVYPLCCYPIPETPALDTEEMFLSFIELVRSPLLSEADRSTWFFSPSPTKCTGRAGESDSLAYKPLPCRPNAPTPLPAACNSPAVSSVTPGNAAMSHVAAVRVAG